VKLEISATDAHRRFSEILNRVRYRNETFVVKRRGEPICEIVPVRPATFTGRELVELIRSLPHPGKDYLDAVERHVRKQPKAEKTPWRSFAESRTLTRRK
jgi:prevent-host-death family protein